MKKNYTHSIIQKNVFQIQLTLVISNPDSSNNPYNPIALRKAQIVYDFGLSECNRVNLDTCLFFSSQLNLFYCKLVISHSEFSGPRKFTLGYQ